MMPSRPNFRSIGQGLPRADGLLKVTGAATYTAEWDIPDLTYGSVVGSAIACGTVLAIDTTAALAAPGVIAVVTHENAARLHAFPDVGGGQQLTGDGGLAEAWQPLQDATIYYAGQSIAVVVADTSERARYAATLVRVSYNARAPELVMETASRQSFPKLFAGIEPLQKESDDALAAITTAPIRLSLDYESAIHHHNPIELLCSIARWDERDGDDYLTLYDTTRAIGMLRSIFAQSFDMPESNVRIISHYIGGAFGSKCWTFYNPLLVALAARFVKRPVKIEWTRQQMFSIGGHRPGLKQTVSLGAATDGRISGLVHDSHSHSSPLSGYIEFGSRMTRMMYAIPNMGFANALSHLNLPSATVMRGPSFLMGGWALECTLDELATDLRIDPVELRLRNYAETNPDGGLPFSSKNLRACYARGKTLFGWEARDPKPRSKRVGNNFIGYGMASAMHPADRLEATARATIFADGSAIVRSATAELGNGSYTIFRQIAADGFSLPQERVVFELGDSSFPTAPPTMGSMTTCTVGPAVLEAARNAVAALKEVAVREPTSPLYNVPADAVNAHEGRLQLQRDPSIGEEYGVTLGRAGLTHVVAGADSKPGDELKQFSFFSFGATFAEVHVDEATGVVRVARLCGVYDVGRIINPMTAHSQLFGGMIFALGATLMEEALFDPNTGLPVVRNLADYHFPSCADTPDFSIETLGIPDPHIGELGAHGVGEMGCNGVPPAITNAIFNATGRRMRSLPITPDKLLETL